LLPLEFFQPAQQLVIDGQHGLAFFRFGSGFLRDRFSGVFLGRRGLAFGEVTSPGFGGLGVARDIKPPTR
jgi:hypothetical protein